MRNKATSIEFGLQRPDDGANDDVIFAFPYFHFLYFYCNLTMIHTWIC